MADRVQEQTLTLEAQVATRTRELRSSNAALEQANEDLARAVDELERLANTDGLTQLSNHRSFQESLATETRRSARTKQPMVLFMIDVDKFKSYNDTHGHPAGDKVLVQISRILQRALRDTDVVARYGGEEFAVILLDTPLEDGAKVAEKLRQAVRQTAFPGARKSQPSGRITISLGMAALPEHGIAPIELLEAADTALYAAKHAGRDRIQVYEVQST
jgi:diguanylate cyclase (GGDEF)-like protein